MLERKVTSTVEACWVNFRKQELAPLKHLTCDITDRRPREMAGKV